MTRSVRSGARLLRVVLDTNIVVSSLLSSKGAPARIMDAWRAMRFLLVVCPAILQEIRATLHYPRIQRKYGLSVEVIDELMALFARDALVVPGNVCVACGIPADPKDEMFLACAVEGQADLIVSGDRHLLSLGAYRGVPIVTAQRLLEELALES